MNHRFYDLKEQSPRRAREQGRGLLLPMERNGRFAKEEVATLELSHVV